MQVAQVYTIVNKMTDEFVGDSIVVKEDLSNVVDIGKAIFDVTSVDNYVKKLLDVIGRMVFVNERYRSKVPDILFDSWEYGSVVEKISANLTDASVNESWSLTNGETYNQDVYYAPSVNVSFFNKKVTFEIPCSFAEIQVKESFNSVSQLNSFFSMIQTMIENSMTIKLDGLIMSTLRNMIGQTLLADEAAFTPTGGTLDYGTASTLKCVNLLYLYNEMFDTNLTADACLTEPAFARFTAYVMNLYVDRLTTMSTKFNIDGMERFTEPENLRVVLLSELASAHKVYLQSDTYHDSLVALPNGYDTVPFWQGNGGDYSFENNSKVYVTVEDRDEESLTGKKDIEIDGVVGIMFSRYACGVNQFNRRTTTHYNAKAEFYTNYAKTDANYFNALDEDFVVFFVADAPTESEGDGE